MKQKLLLFFFAQLLLMPAIQAQDTIRHLIISKWNGGPINQAFAQVTNVGDSSIDLSNFTFTNVNGNLPANGLINGVPYWNAGPRYSLRLSGRLNPGESFLMMNVWDALQANGLTQHLEQMLPLADVKVHATDLTPPHPVAIPELELWGKDSISTHDFLLRHHSGYHASILYYRLPNGDSVAIDQANLAYNPVTNELYRTAATVAGVAEASYVSFLVRKANIKRGNTNWDNSRGTSAEDSEWIALPKWQGRTPYTTLKNFGNYQVSLQSTSADINVNDKIITVEWGTERGDSILNVLTPGPGMAWQYVQSPESADSAYNTVREGDIFEAYACGNSLSQINFELKVAPPAPDNAKVFPRRNYSLSTGFWTMGSRYYVTKNIPVIDTIGNVPFATRVDTMLAYLEKAPDASWEISWVDGQARVDLKNGDKLKVTAENGTTVKEYYIDVQDYSPSSNANLSAITWPDLPFFLDGWKGDTIPLFSSTKTSYNIVVPYGTSSVPALKATPSNLRAKIKTVRATSLTGSLAERTTIFSLTAEDDSTLNQYSVIFELEKSDEMIQKYYGEPMITEVVTNYASWISSLEIFNPRNVPLDLSEYLIVRSTSLNPGTAITNAIPAVPTDANFQNRYISYVPGYKFSDDTTTWKVSPGKLYIDPAIDPVIEPGETFVMSSVSIGRYIYIDDQNPWLAERINKRWDSGDATSIDPLGVNVRMTPPGLKRGAEAVFLYKITNDSVLNGTKQIGDPNDFLLVDAFGDAVADAVWKIAGRDIANATNCRIRLKSHVYKGETILGAGFGTNADNSNWIVNVLGDPGITAHILHEFIGLHDIDPITVHLSTISSLTYLVSSGYEELQTVQGDLSGSTLEQFYLNISKAAEAQVLTMKSGVDGSEKVPADLVTGGDTLIVLSADGLNSTKYLLVNQPLDDNAVLTAKEGSGYTIEITGNTATISGIEYGATLKEVLDNVIKPVSATLNVIDSESNLVPLMTLNYDTVYVDTKAGDSHYFELVAQNGVNKITYKLVPAALSSDAFVISSIYTVDQDSLIISGIPYGTSVPVFFENINVVRGASASVTDKKSYLREMGFLSYDDRLSVTSEDLSKTVIYYLDFLTEMNPDRAGDPTSNVQGRQFTENLLIYPNPTKGRIFMKGVPENAVIHLTDMMGRTISISRAADIHDGLLLEEQPAGVYFILVTDSKQYIRYAKIIKQ